MDVTTALWPEDKVEEVNGLVVVDEAPSSVETAPVLAGSVAVAGSVVVAGRDESTSVRVGADEVVVSTGLKTVEKVLPSESTLICCMTETVWNSVTAS